MTPEERRLIQETLDLSRENNQILKKMRRGQFIGNIIHSLKWVVLIIITIYSWIVIQPYFEQMLSMYTQVQDATDSVNSMKLTTDMSGLQNWLETFRIGGSE